VATVRRPIRGGPFRIASVAALNCTRIIWNAYTFRFHYLSANRRADYNRFLDALTAAKAQAGIKNTDTAFGLLLDAAEKGLNGTPDTTGSTCRESRGPLTFR